MLAAGEAIPGVGRKRLRSDEEEDGNANKKPRIHGEEAGQKDLDGPNGNQDSEVAEDEKTEGLDVGGTDEDPNRGRKRKRQDDENEEEKGNQGSGNNVNRQNSERNGSGGQESGGDEGDEDDENDNNEEEKRRRRAAEKGKQPVSCNCEPVVRAFVEMEPGESSNTLEDHTPFDIDDYRDLAILRSMWNFKNINGNSPHLPSDKLLNYILFSIPNLKLSRKYLKMKIMEFESNFKVIIQMDGDNPYMLRPIDREVFYMCKLLWGNPQQQQQRPQRVQCGNQQQAVHFCLVYYQQGDDFIIVLTILR